MIKKTLKTLGQWFREDPMVPVMIITMLALLAIYVAMYGRFN